MKRYTQTARAGIYRITLDAMLVAIHVLLGMVPSELSWQSLPVLLCAFLLGPVDTLAVSVMGAFIEQVRYGLNATTLLWMLPWILVALFAGLAAYSVRKKPSIIKAVIIIVIFELLLNIANTSVLCFFGYLSVDFSASLPVLIVMYLGRMPQALIRSVLSSVVIPALLPPLRKALARMH